MSANFYIRRIALQQLRKFDALEIDALSPGLNIIAGPNGAGKSSLARAIRAAFLDRYGSSSAADLMPIGNSGAAPTVALDFALHGKPHQLTKTFIKKKRCDLYIGSSLRSEQDAEDYLAEQLGFGFGKRGSGEEHWGVPGLLWVEQGAAPGQLAARVGHASPQLGAALHAQAGGAAPVDGVVASLAATTGDALIAQLEQALNCLVSRANRKPTGDYAVLLDKLDTQRAQLHQQQQRVQDYRAQVDELQQLLGAEQDDAAKRPDLQWQAELMQAQERIAALQQLQQKQQQAQAQTAQLQTTIDALQRELQQQHQQQRKLQERQAAMQSAEQAHQQAGAAVRQAQTGSAAMQQELAAANQQWQTAQQTRERQALQARWDDGRRQLQRLQASSDVAQQQLQKLQLLAPDLSVLALEKADIEKLKKLEDAALKAALQRDAVATRLQFALPGSQMLAWQSGEQAGQLSGEGEAWLDGATDITLPGGGSLRITPGGAQVAGVAQRHADAEAALAQHLQHLQVASRAEAEQRWERRQQLEAEQRVAQQLLAAQAPQGIDALQLELRQLSTQLQGLQAQLQTLPAKSEGADLDWPAAQTAQQAATQALQQAQAAEHAARQQLAVAAQQLQSAAAELAAAQHGLQEPAAVARVQAAQKQLVVAEAELAQLQQQLLHTQAALQAPDTQFAAQDAERLTRSLQAHAEQQRARSLRTAHLRAALEAAGAQGLEEENAALAGEIAHGERRAAAIASRVQALVTLVDRLKAKRAAALRRLQAPLEARMQHYLQLLLPGARMELDAQLLPQAVLPANAAITPDGAARRVLGDVAALSYGTQEQLAIISRLAYADLLRDAGQPTLLMLDDALTFSDPQRLAQMKRVLYDGATRHQILLLTCHPDNWSDMGVALRQLPGA
ncbi:MAG: AAA family ATPase [Comamonas sp.]